MDLYRDIDRLNNLYADLARRKGISMKILESADKPAEGANKEVEMPHDTSKMPRDRVKLYERVYKLLNTLGKVNGMYGDLARITTPIITDHVDTMAMDKDGNLWIGEDFFNDLTDESAVTIFAHELHHRFYEHVPQAVEKNYDMQLWNFATDYAINRDLMKEGFNIANVKKVNGEKVEPLLPKRDVKGRFIITIQPTMEKIDVTNMGPLEIYIKLKNIQEQVKDLIKQLKEQFGDNWDKQPAPGEDGDQSKDGEKFKVGDKVQDNNGRQGTVVGVRDDPKTGEQFLDINWNDINNESTRFYILEAIQKNVPASSVTRVSKKQSGSGAPKPGKGTQPNQGKGTQPGEGEGEGIEGEGEGEGKPGRGKNSDKNKPGKGQGKGTQPGKGEGEGEGEGNDKTKPGQGPGGGPGEGSGAGGGKGSDIRDDILRPGEVRSRKPVDPKEIDKIKRSADRRKEEQKIAQTPTGGTTYSNKATVTEVDPGVNWANLLNRFMTKASEIRSSLMPQKRYYATGIYQRSQVQLKNQFTCTLLIDTSGSITPHMFQRLMTEVLSIMRRFAYAKINIILWNDNAYSDVSLFGLTTRDVEKIKKIQFKSGGTNLSSAVRFYKQHEYRYLKDTDVIVVFTDGDFYTDEDTSPNLFDSIPSRIPVLVCLVKSPNGEYKDIYVKKYRNTTVIKTDI